MNAEEATKILAEKRRLAREQKEKEEERLQKEMEQRLAQNHPFYTVNLGWGLNSESQTLSSS